MKFRHLEPSEMGGTHTFLGEGNGGIVDFFEAADARTQADTLKSSAPYFQGRSDPAYGHLLLIIFLWMPIRVVECFLGSRHSILHIPRHLSLFLHRISVVSSHDLSTNDPHLC